ANMPGRLAGKTAIVTGAAGGIGAAVARRFAREGAGVIIADLHADAAQAVAGSIARDEKAKCIGLACDVSSEDQVQQCVQRALKEFGSFDIAVNNAGVMMFKAFSDWTPQDWRKVLDVDLLGAAFFTREAFHHMRPGGAIVNIASVHAVETTANVAPYAAAKAALLSVTRSAAIEGRDRKIRANAILPGAIDTPMLWSNPNIKSGAETIAKEDVGQPEDIAAAAAFVGSDDAKFSTGASLAVDGG